MHSIVYLQSMNSVSSKNYPRAKQYGKNALILTILNIIFTMFMAMLMTGLITGLICADPSSYYAYYFSRYRRSKLTIQW